MPWFAIRTVYHFGVKKDGTNVFEERVVCFEADSSAQAHEKAQVEADAYASKHNYLKHPEQSGYQQDGTPQVDGYEVWSELFQSREPLKKFYAKRYETYLYTPDAPV
jgi:hypothetical protein